MGQFHFDPASYERMMADEVPGYAALQDAVVEATLAVAPAAHVLELGTGTGVTTRAVLTAHAGARLVGIDHGERMLEIARAALPETDLRHGRLEDLLPAGAFDLVFSALAVHHLDGAGKAALFTRVAGALAPGGRFVLGDLVVPEDPADVVTPIDGEIDTPSGIAEQLGWLAAAGLEPALAWRDRDLAVLVGDRPR
jgi:trans-aconitate methyltransferase